MLLPLLHEMLHTPVLDILHHLKRSTGMTVGELGTAMDMSYMGIKQHCDDLVAKGMLDTWRRPKKSGRPEKLYRITHKLDPLFTTDGLALTLDLLATAQRVYGETAAAKLLYAYYQSKTEALAAKLNSKETLLQRAKSLARHRTADGCISILHQDETTGALTLTEHHQPLRELTLQHEIIDELECEMIERLLQCEVRRTITEVSGLVQITFHLLPRAG
jgi:predicted ArsR family transcriptional regulator